ncbi:RNA-binding domain-containing protein [Mycena chlorophos]|uniref:RNA-binding domain-containing protein n=1 Tax=Mycena chlorophos TaxID=658473 RepID=A0A8H6WEG9_MYCCL|nr:RNA-binding domain-containing protein [Mycena chlorophos]
MSTRGRSPSPRSPTMDIDRRDYPSVGLRVVVITNLTRNVAETHLKTIFGFYGDILQIDLPTFGKSGQNRGKAALEYFDSSAAAKAVSYMDGGQIDGAVVKVELSDLPEGTVEPAVQDVQGVTRSTVAVVAIAEVVAAHLVATPIGGRGRLLARRLRTPSFALPQPLKPVSYPLSFANLALPLSRTVAVVLVLFARTQPVEEPSLAFANQSTTQYE